MSKCNPDHRSPEQVGVADGWRLLNEDEIITGYRAVMGLEMWTLAAGWVPADYGASAYITYRTKLTTAELRKARGLEPISQPATDVPPVGAASEESFRDRLRRIREDMGPFTAEQRSALQEMLANYLSGYAMSAALEPEAGEGNINAAARVAYDCKALRTENASLKAEVEQLKECLEPGKASVIIDAMFREARRLGFYEPTGKHALTQFVEEVEKLRAKLETAEREWEKWKQWQEVTRQGGQVLAAERDSLRQQLAASEQIIAEVRAEREAAQRALVELNSEIDKLQKDLNIPTNP